jgi:hypothetical protein
MTSTRPPCCFIEDDGSDCEQEAEWEIWYSLDPNDFTQACPEHVGFLLEPQAANYIYPLYPDDT